MFTISKWHIITIALILLSIFPLKSQNKLSENNLQSNSISETMNKTSDGETEAPDKKISKNDILKSFLKNGGYNDFVEDSVITYSYDLYMDSVYYSKYSKSYNNNDQDTLSAFYMWDENANEWIHNDITRKEYDVNGRMTLEESYQWNKVLNDWEKIHKEIYNYNSNGKRSGYFSYWGSGIENNNWRADYFIDYTYDSNATEYSETMTTSIWNESSADWKYYHKDEFVYNLNNRLLLCIYWYWDEASNNWLGSSKDEYEYDQNGNRTLYSCYSWDQSVNDWSGSWKWESTYNEDNNLTLGISYEWDPEINDWIYNVKSILTYNDAGERNDGLDLSWNKSSETWGNLRYYTYTFGNDGNLNSKITSFWNDTIKKWMPEQKNEYKYDADGYLIYQLEYNWNNLNISIGSYMELKTYNSNGTETFNANYDWNDSLQIWTGRYKRRITYDENYNIILAAYYYWDHEINDWCGEHKYVRGYNENQQWYLTDWYEWDIERKEWREETRYISLFDIYGNTTVISTYYHFTNIWQLGTREFHHYHATGPVTSIPGTAFEGNNCSFVYPNPSSGQFHVYNNGSYHKIQVFDLYGRQVYANILSQEINIIDLEGNPKGLYFMYLTANDNKTITSKLIIR